MMDSDVMESPGRDHFANTQLRLTWDAVSEETDSSEELMDEAEDTFRMCDLAEVAEVSTKNSSGASTPAKLTNLVNFEDCNVPLSSRSRKPQLHDQLLHATLPHWQLLAETRQLRKLLSTVHQERKRHEPPAEITETVKLRAQLIEKEEQLQALARKCDQFMQDVAHWRRLATQAAAAEAAAAAAEEQASQFQRQPSSCNLARLKTSPRRESSAPIRVIFQIAVVETCFKDAVRVVGEHEVMGSWQAKDSLSLETTFETYPSWQSKELLYFPADVAKLRYKYVRDRSIRKLGFGWEDLIPNREVVIPGPLPNGYAWLVRDVAFNYNEKPLVSRVFIGQAA